jgi:hypothetical protein
MLLSMKLNIQRPNEWQPPFFSENGSPEIVNEQGREEVSEKGSGKIGTAASALRNLVDEQSGLFVKKQ